MLRVIIIVNCYYKKLFFKCTQLSAVGGYLTLWKKKTVHIHYRVQVFMCTSFCREPDGLCQRQSSEEAQTFLF